MPGGRRVGDSIFQRVFGQADPTRCMEAPVPKGIRDAAHQTSDAQDANPTAPEPIGSDQSSCDLGPESELARALPLQLIVRPLLERFRSSRRIVGKSIHRRTG